MPWKLRQTIKDSSGTVTAVNWPGDPGTKLSQQQRMVTEAAVDVTDLNADLTLLSSVALNVVRPNGHRREYDVIEF